MGREEENDVKDEESHEAEAEDGAGVT